MKRSIALLIAVLMIFGILAGCGNTSSGGNETTSAPTLGTEDITAVNGVGTVLVNAGAVITVIYDAEGTVVKLVGMNENGKELVSDYESQLGSSCAMVVSECIKDGVMQEYMFDINHVVVKLNKGSALPEEKFLENIEAAVQETLNKMSSSASLVMIGEENLDHNGYIDLVTAKVLVEKFLQVDELDSFDGTDMPIDGWYGFNVLYGSMEEQILVNAETGGVAQGTLDELEDGLDEIEEEETIPENEEEPTEE